MNSARNAIVLFSGGLDSTTCLAIAKAAGFNCYALSFAYGQKHAAELVQAKKIAAKMGVKAHKILNLPLDQIGGSSLTDNMQSVPDFKEGHTSIPSTYVPARNTIFLSFALGYGEVVEAHDIFIGANIIDYSGYPDCRPEYLHAFEQLARLATKDGVDNQVSYKIHSPLLQWNKAEIIKHGLALGVDYSQTVSCYRADEQGRACGSCDSCAYRKKGFSEAGVTDPTMYV